jgi:hypothetical protein
MTEKRLVQFINENDIDYGSMSLEDGDICIFLKISQLKEFDGLIKAYSNHGPVSMELMAGFLFVPMKKICDFYDIDMNKIFKFEDEI